MPTLYSSLSNSPPRVPPHARHSDQNIVQTASSNHAAAEQGARLGASRGGGDGIPSEKKSPGALVTTCGAADRFLVSPYHGGSGAGAAHLPAAGPAAPPPSPNPDPRVCACAYNDDSLDGSIPLLAKRGCSSRQQDDDDSEGGKRVRYSGPDLPEDIWLHIFSLVPLKDAARAACVSRTFRRCWRCYPNITFSNSIVGLNRDVRGKGETASEYASKVNQVLTNHSGIGLKTMDLAFFGHRSSDCCFLYSWLQVALTPQLEKLILLLSSNETRYSFPCSLLSDQCGNSIRHLHLAGCFFHPVVSLRSFKSLAKLYLYNVRINEDELGVLLSSCSALEQFGFGHNNQITCLKIPCMLQQLRDLRVVACNKLQVIESKAPNLSSLYFDKRVQLSLGESLQLKKLTVFYTCALDDARDMLLSTMPNLETLDIASHLETNTPIMRSQFLCLKYLEVSVDEYQYPPNDYISLVPFLDASPSLETFVLNAREPMEHESIFSDRSPLRRMLGHRHEKLKSVRVIGFNSAKSFTLDTVGCAFRCSDINIDKCFTICKSTRMEVPLALLAIQKYIQCKIPPPLS